MSDSMAPQKTDEARDQAILKNGIYRPNIDNLDMRFGRLDALSLQKLASLKATRKKDPGISNSRE